MCLWTLSVATTTTLAATATMVRILSFEFEFVVVRVKREKNDDPPNNNYGWYLPVLLEIDTSQRSRQKHKKPPASKQEYMRYH